MNRNRLRIIRRALLAAALLALPGLAAAQAPDWPTRPIRVIIPQPPGGVLDTLIRSLAEPLAPRLGQPIIVDNRPGGNNAIGLEACANAAPDGHTLCAVSIEVMSVLPEELRLDAHGQGYDMVERPLIRADESWTLERGMCLALHPGYETEAIFAVICDNYMVEADGPGPCLHATGKRLFEI